MATRRCKRGRRKNTRSCRRKPGPRKRKSKKRKRKRKSKKRKRKSKKRKSRKKYRMEPCESYMNNTGNSCPKCCSAHKTRCQWMGMKANPRCKTKGEQAAASEAASRTSKLSMNDKLEKLKNDMTIRLENDILNDNVDIIQFKRFFVRRYVHVFNMKARDVNNLLEEVITGRTSNIVLDYLKEQTRLQRQEQQRLQEDIIRRMGELDLSSDEEGDVCTICYDVLNNGERLVELNCGHIFHHACLIDFRNKGDESVRLLCPTCRAPYHESLLN